MPIRDATGKPLSGAALRRRKAERASAQSGRTPTAGASHSLEDTQEPPGSLDEILVWAQALQARCALLADDEEHADRARLVGQVLACLAKLKGVARESEDAVTNLACYRLERVDTRGKVPPVNPLGVALWALLQLTELAHRVATEPALPDEGGVLARAKALAQVGLFHPQTTFDRLAESLRKSEKG